jgi:hypothetical protein
MKYYLTFCIVFFITINCQSQELYPLISDSRYPQPAIGWDSLKGLIIYPELVRRAGLEGTTTVILSVDSTGLINHLDVSSDIEMCKTVVIDVLRKVKWIPAKVDGKYSNTMLMFPIHFFIKKFGDSRRMIIEVEPAKPQTSH